MEIPFEPGHMDVLMKAIRESKFREFTDADWMTWQGCQSLNPMIAEVDEKYVVILDESGITVTVPDGKGNFKEAAMWVPGMKG